MPRYTDIRERRKIEVDHAEVPTTDKMDPGSMGAHGNPVRGTDNKRRPGLLKLSRSTARAQSLSLSNWLAGSKSPAPTTRGPNTSRSNHRSRASTQGRGLQRGGPPPTAPSVSSKDHPVLTDDVTASALLVANRSLNTVQNQGGVITPAAERESSWQPPHPPGTQATLM